MLRLLMFGLAGYLALLIVQENSREAAQSPLRDEEPARGTRRSSPRRRSAKR